MAIENVAILQEAGSVSELVYTEAKSGHQRGFDSQTFKHVESRHSSYTILAVFFRMSPKIIDVAPFTLHHKYFQSIFLSKI